MSFSEYQGWVQYFEEINSTDDKKKPSKSKPNLMNNEDAMLTGFGL
jgi:regulator of RNase E activity RraB